MKKIGVSACLLGYNVRYDGSNKQNNKLINILKNVDIIPICPEILGGFNIPHPPCEIKNNKVIDINNNDMSDIFKRGAFLAFEKIKDCDFVILKTKSPSCGHQKIYDGSFSGKLIKGNGLFTRLCIDKNIKIFSEEDIKQIQKEINGD